MCLLLKFIPISPSNLQFLFKVGFIEKWILKKVNFPNKHLSSSKVLTETREILAPFSLIWTIDVGVLSHGQGNLCLFGATEFPRRLQGMFWSSMMLKLRTELHSPYSIQGSGFLVSSIMGEAGVFSSCVNFKAGGNQMAGP